MDAELKNNSFWVRFFEAWLVPGKEQHTGERWKQEHRNIAAPPKAVAMSREHHAIAIFSRAKASFTATERSLRS